MRGQEFFHDFENDIYYLVNFQEERYMKIAEKGNPYYELCQNLYCHRWDSLENPPLLATGRSKQIVENFRKVDTLRQIGGVDD